MENEARNTEQPKDNVENEARQTPEALGDATFVHEDSLEFAPNDPFAPPKEHRASTGEMPAVPIVSAEDAANPEIGGDIEVERPRKRKRHPVLKALATVIAVLLAACGACCGWLVYDDDRNASCHVPEGVTLDGVSVSGFSADEVESLVKKHVQSGNVGSTTLDVNGQEFKLDSVHMGEVDVDATVDVVMSTIESDRVKRCVNRVLGLVGRAPDVDEVSLRTVCVVDEAKVAQRVESIAQESDVAAVDAGYTYDDEHETLRIVSAKEGQTLNVEETTSAVLDAFENGLTAVNASLISVEPAKTEAGYGIFINRTKCFLYLYSDGKLVDTYVCSPGTEEYPTPKGNWTIVAKDESPTWTNPHTEWSSNMPETVAPGEDNPLGLRALELSCSGTYIHGTSSYKKLGKPNGYGSVAIGNASIAELFDLVDVGTPVFIR